MSQPAAKTLSVVVPFFNEQENVEALHAQIVSAVMALDPSGGMWEIVYVDDGSTDDTLNRLLSARASLPAKVSVISLRRNFGQTAALAAGFKHSRGEVIVTLDGDLQNDPADLVRLLDSINRGFDVVSGWRRERRDPLLLRRLPSRLGNWLIGAVTGVPLHDYGCTLKAYRREIVEHLTLYGEMHRFLPAQAHWVGARICEIPVNHRPRRAGASKYGLRRTYRVLLDLVTVHFLGTHGTKPLHAFGALGLAFIGAGVLTILWLTWLKYSQRISFIQSPLLLLAAMFVILGGQSILLGLLAEISVRTYYESQHKPTYVVKEIHASRQGILINGDPAAAPGTPGRPGSQGGS